MFNKFVLTNVVQFKPSTDWSEFGIYILQGIKAIVKGFKGDKCQSDDHPSLQAKICVILVACHQAHLRQLLLHVLDKMKQASEIVQHWESILHQLKCSLLKSMRTDSGY